jgi:hypothetical protein
MRYPVRYTKLVTLEQLKVGDKIEPSWRWEDDYEVVQVLEDRVIFQNGKEWLFENFPSHGPKQRLIKTRMSKTPEHFNQP